jgi:hypothetical protein
MPEKVLRDSFRSASLQLESSLRDKFGVEFRHGRDTLYVP